ncbi:hypothetical protein [Escherichia phage vB_EcoM_IME392]|nr:hypothetical protein [Escherichia phage vB_EcoM_IME392]
MNHKCRICSAEVRGQAFPSHAKSHGLTPHEYYLKFFPVKICSCGKPCSFKSVIKGYRPTCGRSECATRARSVSMTNRNIKMWEDENYQKKMSKVISSSNHKRWLNPEYANSVIKNLAISTIPEGKVVFYIVLDQSGNAKYGITSNIERRLDGLGIGMTPLILIEMPKEEGVDLESKVRLSFFSESNRSLPGRTEWVDKSRVEDLVLFVNRSFEASKGC